MKISVKPENIKYFLLGAGGLGALLRALLYLTGTDAKGLLVPGHWAHVGLWIVTFAAAAGLFFLTRTLTGPEQYRDCYPTSFAGAVGCFVGAAALGYCGFSEIGSGTSTLDTAELVLTFAAAAAMVRTGLCRLTQAKPHFALHGVISLCFALRMVCQYRYWSADPQLLDYCFYLGAHVGLMLTAYQLAAFDAEMGDHKKLWRTGLATVYLCAAAVYGGGLRMLCWGCWAFTNLTCLTTRPRRQRPALVLDEESPDKV